MQRIRAARHCGAWDMGRASSPGARTGLAGAGGANHHSAGAIAAETCRPPARRRIAEAPGPAVPGGEQARWRAEHRDAGLRGICARRVHVLHYVEPADRLQPVPLQDPAVQSRHGFELITNLFFNSVALVANSKLAIKTIPEEHGRAVEGQAWDASAPGTFSFPMDAFHGEAQEADRRGGGVPCPIAAAATSSMPCCPGRPQSPFSDLPTCSTRYRSAGLITGIALNANARSPLFPYIPTLAEANGEDYPAGLVRPVRAARHAEADHGEAPRRGRAHHQRSGIPEKEFRRSRHRLRGEHAGGVREIHRARSQERRADLQGVGPAAAIGAAANRGVVRQDDDGFRDSRLWRATDAACYSGKPPNVKTAPSQTEGRWAMPLKYFE